MAATKAELQLLVTATDKTGPAFASAKSGMDGLTGMAGKAGLAVAAGVAVGTAAVAGLAVVAVKSAGEFQSQMKQVETLGADFGKPFAAVQGEVSKLATAMGVDATDAATTLYNAVSAGIPAGNALEFMEVAAKAAVGGAASLDEVGSAMGVVINSWGEDAGSAMDISDKLFQTVKAGVTTMPELASAIGGVSGIAAAAGVTFDETAAAIAQITTKGKTTSVAVTGLKGIMAELMTPTSKSSAALQELGFSSSQAAIDQLGLQGVLEALVGSADAANVPITALFGSVDAGAAVLDLTGENAAAFTEKLDGMETATGNTERALAKVNEGWERQLELLQGKGAGALREIGLTILPILSQALIAMTPAIDALGTGIGRLTADFRAIFGGELKGAEDSLALVSDGLGIMSDDVVIAEEVSSSFRDKLLLLKEKFEEVKDAFEEGGIVAALSEIVGFDLQPVVDTFIDIKDALIEVKDFVIEHKDLIIVAAGAYLGFMAAMKVNALIGVVGGALTNVAAAWKLYRSGADLSTIATKLFGASVKVAMGPIGWIILAIGVAVGVLGAMWATNFGDIRGKTAKFVTWIKTLPAKFAEVWNGVAAGFGQLKIKLSEKWEEVKTWMGTWGVVLLGILFPISLLFTQQGRDILDGLKKGLSEKWGEIKQWFSDKLAELPGAVKKFFGIASPSKLFARLGRWIMEGFALGIGAGGVTVLETLDVIMGKIAEMATSGVIEKAQANLAALGTEIGDLQVKLLADSGDASGAAEVAGLISEGNIDEARRLWARYYDDIKTLEKERHENVLAAYKLESETLLGTGTENSLEHAIRRLEALKDALGPGSGELSDFSGEVDRIETDFARLIEMHGGAGSKALDVFYSKWTNGAVMAITNTKELMDAIAALKEAEAARLSGLIEAETTTHNNTMAGYEERVKIINRLLEDETIAAETVNALLAERAGYIADAQAAMKAAQSAQEAFEERVHDDVVARLDALMEAREAAHEIAMTNLEAERDEILDRFADQEEAIKHSKVELESLKIDLGLDAENEKLKALKDELANIQRVMKSIQVITNDPREFNKQQREQRISKTRLTDEQKAVTQSAIDSGLLSPEQMKKAKLAMLGYKIRVEDINAIWAHAEQIAKNNVDEQQGIIDAKQEELDIAIALIANAEHQLELDRDRNVEVLKGINERIGLEEQRWKDEKAQIEDMMKREDQRHADRMGDIAGEWAFRLASLGMSEEEIREMIGAAQEVAKKIAEEAAKVYEDIIKGIGEAVDAMDPIELPPFVLPPLPPGFPGGPPGVPPPPGDRPSSGFSADGGFGVTGIEFGDLIIEGTEINVTIDGDEIASKVVDTMVGSTTLLDKLGDAIFERSAQRP